MRKPMFCICENKGTDQLRSNCTDRFVSDLLGNYIYGFLMERLIYNELMFPTMKFKAKLDFFE